MIVTIYIPFPRWTKGFQYGVVVEPIGVPLPPTVTAPNRLGLVSFGGATSIIVGLEKELEAGDRAALDARGGIESSGLVGTDSERC